MKAFLKRQKKKLKKRFDNSTKGKINRIIDDPPKVDPKSIVFTSSFDYSGNPKALFLYMIEHGFNEKYKITWLFEHKENMVDFDIPNVRSVCMFNDKHERTPEAQTAIMSARFIFYSHNVNWCKKFRDDQIFVNLWHGCGYKADQKSDKRKIYYDYLMVTGKHYIDIFKVVLKDPDGNVLDLGYPRNEFLFSNRSDAVSLLEDLKREAGAEKAVIWLPTYRKSTVERLSSDIDLGDTGLPILYDEKMIKSFDAVCRKAGVLLIVKQHFLQKDYEVAKEGLTNIRFLKDEYLRDRNADFYELMGRTDAMITDYSSVAIDYMLIDKPMAYTLDDYDKYEEARGWSFDNVKDFMPGNHIYTVDDLGTFINDVAEGKDPHREWRARVTDEVHTYKEGFSERILEYFNITNTDSVGVPFRKEKPKPLLSIKILKIRDNTLILKGEHTFGDRQCCFTDDKGREYPLGNRYFELSIPLKRLKSLTFSEDIKSISCGKHGKLHNNLKTSYYERDGYVVTINKGTIKIARPGFKWQLKRELLLDRRIVKKSRKMSLAVYRLLAVLKKKFKKHPVWIVSDRDNACGDNGEALFRYLVKHEKDARIFFVIDAGCSDYARIKQVGKVLKLNSFRYRLNFLAADKIISSQTGEWVTNAFGDDRKYMKSLYDYDYCFLQHGIILNDLSSWFMDYKRDPALFVTSAKREYDSIVNYGFACNEKTVKLTGLPRFDYLTNEPEKKIVFLPTWRRSIAGETVPGTAHRYYSESFKDSDYCKYYNALINDERLVKCLLENGYTGELYIHPAFSVQARDFTGNDVIRVREGVADYNKLMRENSLLITDYSSVVFDFAYLKKPVVYTQFDVEEFLSGHHCSEGYFDYGKDGFGPVATDLESTVDEIIKAIDSGCIMADKYKDRVDGFFAFTDKNNCERVYKAIKALDKKKKDKPSEVSSEARVRSHSFEAGQDAVKLTLDVTVNSDCAFTLKDEVIIDTDLGSEESGNGGSDGRDNRYPIEMISHDQERENGGTTVEAKFTVTIPYERALQMERYNRVYLILDKNGSEEMLRLINDKRREDGIARVIPVPDSSAAIYFNDTLRLFKVEVRERLHTDDPKEQRRLERAWKLSRLTKKHRPVVMYEKDCSRYEESASAVYEALIDRGYRNVYYILDKNYAASADIEPKYRKNIIDRFSFRHYYELFCAKSIVSTETIGHSLERGSVSIPFEKHVMRGKKNYVFLQHGVMYMVPLSAEQRKFFSRPGAKGKQRVVVSSELEAQHFLQNTSYDSREKLYMSGLPKFDRSFRHDDADKIVIMVTWRPWDYNMMTKDPKATSYFRFVERLYDSIPDHLKERTVIAPHPLVTKLMKENGSDTGMWAGYDPDVKYDDLLKDCDVLITDYSSIAYDAFYRGCNVIFCWEQLDECMKHYGKDAKLMLSEDLAFGPVCYNIGDVTETVEKIYKTEHDPQCVSNFRKIVEFSDGKNTERVVEMLAKDGII